MSTQSTIVLTRPLAQSIGLAARLRNLGYDVAQFPLLEIETLPAAGEQFQKLAATLAELKRYALAAFVSPNAIHAIFKKQFIWPAEVAIAVLGEGSRSALAQYGITEKNATIFSPTDPLRSDSEQLLHSLDLSYLKGREVVIFRAETGRELMAEALTEKGIKVDKIVAYRRLAPTLTVDLGNQLNHLLSSTNTWIVSSSEAIRTLEDLVRKVAGEPGVVKLHQVKLMVTHQRIAEIAEKCGFKQVQLIGLGDENLMVALQSHL